MTSHYCFDRRGFLRLGVATGLSLVTGCRQSGAPATTPGLAASPTSTPAQGYEFIVRNRRPNDLETPVEVFESYLTPNERFFVRSHHPEPKISQADWSLRIQKAGSDPVTVSFEDLTAFQPATVTAVLQCAGNSRDFYRPRVPGVQWGRGAVGNARWTGARLADVLAGAGVDSESPENVVVSGADKPLMATVPVFERNLSLSKCLHPDTLLAYEMNGEPLPSLHGGPVRLVVPGWVGDDWIKWVTSISVQAEPSDGFYYQKGYRYPDVAVKPGDAVPPESMKPMEELVTRSLFASPSQNSRLSLSAPVSLKGVSWTGGEKTVVKVEVSDDGGKSWTTARFHGQAEPYAWRQWELDWQPTKAGPTTLLCRATDSSGFVQPVEDSPWNPGGYLWKSADRLELEVES